MNEGRPRNDAAMAEILSSIRRIVAEENNRAPRAGAAGDDAEILDLTPAMRLPDDAPRAAPEEAYTLSADEATIADIARAVLRDEFDGEIGRLLEQRIRDTVRVEVARVLEQARGVRD